jgi:hypothetical protein
MLGFWRTNLFTFEAHSIHLQNAGFFAGQAIIFSPFRRPLKQASKRRLKVDHEGMARKWLMRVR